MELGTLAISDDDLSTSSKKAKAHFMLGLKAVHSFSYDLAIEQFGKAVTDDKCFFSAQAYHSFSYAMMIWHYFQWGKAEDSFKKMRSMKNDDDCAGLYDAMGDLEKGMIEGIEVMWNLREDMTASEQMYAAIADFTDRMKALVDKYPDSIEAAAMYGLGLLSGKTADRAELEKVILEARQVLEKHIDSRHPGILHFILHAYDFPPPTPLGGDIANLASDDTKDPTWHMPLKAADIYMSDVKSAPHALHMPSHVYMRLGNFTGSHLSNRLSIEAAEQYCDVRFGDDDKELGGKANKYLTCEISNLYHGVEYLANDAMQLGRVEEAISVFERMQGVVEVARTATGCGTELGSVLGVGGTEECQTVWLQPFYRMQARVVMDRAMLSDEGEWEKMWPAYAKAAGLGALPDKLPNKAEFSKDAGWSPISEAGLILAGAGGLVLDTDAKASDRATGVQEAAARMKVLAAAYDTADFPKRAKIVRFMDKMLEGLAAYALPDGETPKNKAELVVESLIEAVEIQEELVAAQTASDITLLFVPSWELLATIAMSDSDVAAAAAKKDAKYTPSKLFRRTLEIRPGRASSILGLARALRAEGEAQQSYLEYKDLDFRWKEADENLAVLSEVRERGLDPSAAPALPLSLLLASVLSYFVL